MPGAGPDAARVLYLLLKAEGIPDVKCGDLERSLARGAAGVTLGDLVDRVERLGGHASACRMPLDRFLALDRPGILAMADANAPENPGRNRFVLCRGRVSNRGLRLVDPRQGARDVPLEIAARDYRDVALVLDTRPRTGQNNEPDLAVEEIAWTFGEVTRGSRIAHVFRVANQGAKPLRFLGVDAACGCAAALLRPRDQAPHVPSIYHVEPPVEGWGKTALLPDAAPGLTELAPGAQADLLLVLDTDHKGNDQTVIARLKTNDPDEPVLKLYLLGRVIRKIMCNPLSIFFREVTPDQRVEQELHVTGVTGKPFALTRLRSTSPHVEVTLLGGEARRKDHAIRVVLKPGAPSGAFACHVRFQAHGAPHAVDVAALIRGQIRFQPSHFALGRLPPGTEARAEVIVSSQSGEAFQITDVAVDHPHMNVTCTPLEPGRHRLVLHLGPGWQSPALRANVVVHTSDPREPVATIRAFGFVTRGR